MSSEFFPGFPLRSDLKAGKLTVYGVEGCSWTQKQLAYLKQKHIPFDYVDCDQNRCPKFVDGFPTLDLDGKILVGFQKL